MASIWRRRRRSLSPRVCPHWPQRRRADTERNLPRPPLASAITRVRVRACRYERLNAVNAVPHHHHQKNKTKHQRRFVHFCKQSHPQTAIFKLHSDPHLNLGIKPNLKFLCQNLTFERPESQSEKKSSFECRSKAPPRKSQSGILLKFASKEWKKHSNIQRQSKI